MISRPLYIQHLRKFIDKPQVKIITGIRRSGKSTILGLLREELLNMGVKAEQVIQINFESFVFSELSTAQSLYKYVQEKIQQPQRYYLLLDEIQEVQSWEKAVNSFLVDFDADIYLTGSNSHLLSSELATYLAGRYVEIPVFTISYREFLDFRKHYFHEAKKPANPFVHYLRMGYSYGKL